MQSLTQAKIAIVMGSKSDWKVMAHAAQLLVELNVPYVAQVVSAHRTPDLLYQFAETAEQSGLTAIIAGAGGAAHLPGMLAAKTIVPVIGVPVPSQHLKGLDSLLSIVQMPAGIPVATVALGDAGAKNAALLSVAMLARHDEGCRQRLKAYRQQQTDQVLAQTLSLDEI